MNGDELLALIATAAVLAILLSWPVLPGTRRLAPFKTFPPFRGWAARPHPDAAVPVVAGRRIGRGGQDPAHATVVVRTAWGRYHSRDTRPDFRTAPPLVPVVSVDGTPASWGWGSAKLTLPPGEHLIAVTAGHSRRYRQVRVGRGERIELDCVDVLGAGSQRFSRPGELYDRTSFRERRKGPSGVGLFYLIAAGGFVLAGALTWFLLFGPGGSLEAIGDLIVYGALGLGLAIGIGAVANGFLKQREPKRRADPPGYDDAPRVLDADRPERLMPAAGWAGLSLHLWFLLDEHPQRALEAMAGGSLSLLQRWRSARIGEPEPPGSRPWVPAPEVWINGREVPATWTRMWLQLPPGDYEVTVRVPLPQRQIDGGTAVDLSRGEFSRRVALGEGATTALEVCAQVHAVPRRDRPGLDAFKATLH